MSGWMDEQTAHTNQSTTAQFKRTQTGIFVSGVFSGLCCGFLEPRPTLWWDILPSGGCCVLCLVWAVKLKLRGPGPPRTYQSSSHAVKDKKKKKRFIALLYVEWLENCDTQTHTCSCWQARESSGAIGEAINRTCKAWWEAPEVEKASSCSDPRLPQTHTHTHTLWLLL